MAVEIIEKGSVHKKPRKGTCKKCGTYVKCEFGDTAKQDTHWGPLMEYCRCPVCGGWIQVSVSH